MPAPASCFGTRPSQAPQSQRIQERSTSPRPSRTSLETTVTDLKGCLCPKRSLARHSFRSGNRHPRLGVANVKRARLRAESLLRILPKSVPESLLLRRGSPARRWYIAVSGGHPTLLTTSGSFSRAPTPACNERQTGDHDQCACADDSPCPGRKSTRRRGRIGFLPRQPRRRSRPSGFLLGRNLHPISEKVKVFKNHLVSLNLPQTGPRHFPRHTHHDPRLKPTQVRVVIIVRAIVLEMVLSISLGQLHFPFERLVRGDPARQMPAGRSHILNLRGVNKPNLRQKNSLNTFTCSIDFSHCVSRVFKSEVKLHVTVGLKLNCPINFASRNYKRDKGQHDPHKTRTPLHMDGHIEPPDTPGKGCQAPR